MQYNRSITVRSGSSSSQTVHQEDRIYDLVRSYLGIKQLMTFNKKYNTPISFSLLENEDKSFETFYKEKYKEEIEHFKQTAELYISLFSNSKRTDRDKTKVDYVQLVAIRIFQDTRAALILALKGLFPQSASLLRGVLESYYLAYDFKVNPDHEDLWFNGSKSKREELFKLSEIKKRVEEAKVTDTSPLKGLYNLLSQFSVHINMESHLWYVETKSPNRLFYHWAGYDSVKKSDALVYSCLNSLAQGLFIFTYEDFYAHDKNWANDFTEWKNKHLIFIKRFAKVFDFTGYEELTVKKDKIVVYP